MKSTTSNRNKPRIIIHDCSCKYLIQLAKNKEIDLSGIGVWILLAYHSDTKMAKITISITQLAKELGYSRCYLCKTIDKFEKLGLITRDDEDAIYLTRLWKKLEEGGKQ